VDGAWTPRRCLGDALRTEHQTQAQMLKENSLIHISIYCKRYNGEMRSFSDNLPTWVPN